MSVENDSMSIEVHPIEGGRYKSISRLSWRNLPNFAILTGKNGSGKTQLLELLAYHFSGALPSDMASGKHLPVEVGIAGPTFSPDEIGYIPSSGRFSGGHSTSIASLSNLRHQTLDRAKALRSHRYSIEETIRIHRIIRRFGDTPLNEINNDQLSSFLQDDFEFTIDDVDVTEGLCHVFLAHHLKTIENIAEAERGKSPRDTVLDQKTRAPWDVVNESLVVAGFPYEVISPAEASLLSEYSLRLRDTQTGVEIAARDLSSGEKVLLQLVLWLYTATKSDLLPKLLLLDEPDAHLHPAMTTQFLDVISEILVKRHGVRVIMTTHSPSTVALAPEGAVFQIERGKSTITKGDTRADVISMLTSGLVTVSRATKFCFVEDEDDVVFYNTLRELLSDYGPSKDPMALMPSPSIVFIPVSIGSGKTKVPGGATVVKKWVDKLDSDPLDRTFVGVIDRDLQNKSSDRIFVIERYSFENYLADPLVLYTLLLEENTAPKVIGVEISSGDEHLLRLQPSAVLQTIADEICKVMSNTDGNLASSGTTPVSYTVGKQLNLPSWVIDHCGHDLLVIAQKAFGGPRVVNRPRLIKALKRCRLIPQELAKLLSDIQAR